MPLVHKQGAVWVVLGSETLPVADPAPIIRLLETGKRRGAYPDARGRFSVSPELNVVLKRGASPKDPARQITLALGRLKGPPMWPGKGEEPKEVDAGSAASATATSPESAASSPPTESRSAQSPSAQIPSAQSPSAQSPSAQRKTSGGKSAAWFVLVQEGYLAAVARDQAAVERVAKALSGQRKAWIHEAVAVIAEGTGWPAGADETPPSGLDTLLPYAGKAFVSGRTDLLRRACESFKIGKARKPQRVAIANALAILAGKADEVWLPEEE